jgi:hypothetical protein
VRGGAAASGNTRDTLRPEDVIMAAAAVDKEGDEEEADGGRLAGWETVVGVAAGC